MASADRTRFAQIVMNFGSNAIKYNRPGGSVTLSVSASDPHDPSSDAWPTRGSAFRSTSRASCFSLSSAPVRRPGPSRARESAWSSRSGSRSSWAAASDSAVSRARARSSGSISRRTPPPALAVPPDAARADSTPRLEGRAGRLVLYVEDNPANVSFMRDVIGDFDGIELATVPTAEMGIEVVRSRRPDVVIMDINLPGMSGLEALEALRKDPRTAAIPVIALTAAASERDRQRGMQAGFYRYLTKPVKVDELVSALETLLPPTA